MRALPQNAMSMIRGPISEVPRRIAQILILLLWASIPFSLRNEFRGLLSIAFVLACLLVLLLAKRRYSTLLALSVLTIVLYRTPLTYAWKELAQSNLDTIREPQQTLVKILSPNSGLSVLPAAVREMLSLSQAHGVDRYRLSPRLDQDFLIRSRMLEAAWPARMESTAPHVFFVPGEPELAPACVIIDRKRDVALAYCP